MRARIHISESHLRFMEYSAATHDTVIGCMHAQCMPNHCRFLLIRCLYELDNFATNGNIHCKACGEKNEVQKKAPFQTMRMAR